MAAATGGRTSPAAAMAGGASPAALALAGPRSKRERELPHLLLHSHLLQDKGLKVALTVSMEKGGPRVALFELCRISNWPMPRFEFTELKSRTPIVLNGVTGFSSFTATISLHIPHSTVIKLEGDPRTDKKSSRDSAALTLLGELQKQGRCVLREP